MEVAKGKLRPRYLAVRVLYRVIKDGAWAAPLLDALLQSHAFSLQERQKVTDLVYGALRAREDLEKRLELFLKRGRLVDLEPWTRASLLVAAYELLFTQAKAWAVLDEIVEGVRYERGPGMAAFANAVLRRLAVEGLGTQACPPVSLPNWLKERLCEDLGPDRAHAFIEERVLPPPTTIRARVDRKLLAARLQEACPEAQIHEGALSPWALLMRRVGSPRNLPGYAAGDFCVMDEGSQFVALGLGALSGERILDACAGRGGKSLALLDMTQGQVRLWACDAFPNKLDILVREAKRLGHTSSALTTLALDWRLGKGGIEDAFFDRILVDAPCTGVGTIHRKPELTLRLTQSSIEGVIQLQSQIVQRVWPLLRKGGMLLYAVCSPLRVEVFGAISSLLQDGDAKVVDDPISGFAPDPDGVLRIGPWNDPNRSCDTFQIIRIKRC
ncbi:MAG: hypothetical protein NZM37_02710 [Sandaracinaceae bacterium]|nr:hypothetical protein [Sandaracinaceae bacterium]MDW8245096.1 transcription antitermination factor NusB [Sandaracinaceae bacterium]